MVLINQKNCVTALQGLGLPDCIIKEGRPKGFILTPKDWSLDLTTGTFDIDYVNDQIQQGVFVPILDAVEFTQNTPEATTEEYQGGIMSVVRNGLPQFAFKFIKGGWKYANALNSYNSQEAFNVLFVFSSGAIAGATNNGTLVGFDLGMLNTGTYMFTDGAVSSSVTVSMQLIDENQFNTSVAILDASVLGFNPNMLNPITDIVITGSADVSEGKVYFTPKFSINEASILGGIAIANLRVTVNGVADTIQAGTLVYDSINSRYEFEPTATLTTSTPVVVQLYDTINTVAVAKIGQRYYKGTSLAITPVA